MNKIDDCAEIADVASGAGSAVPMCGPSTQRLDGTDG